MNKANLIVVAIQILCVTEFMIALVEFGQTVYLLHQVSSVFVTTKTLHKIAASMAAASNETMNDTTPSKLSIDDVGTVVIKIVYFILLFFVVEMVLAVFLLRAVQTKNPRNMKIWLILGGIYTVLYITDFISSLHVWAIFDDISLGLGILIKVPLLILVYQHYQQFPSHPGATALVNEL